MQVIKPDALDKAIKDALREYGNEVRDDLEGVVVELSKKAKDEVKNAAPVGARKGKYKKSIKEKEVSKNPLEIAHKIYAEKPHYRLTHLLEYGHATVDGRKRTTAIKHWSKGEEYINKNFERELKEKLERG